MRRQKPLGLGEASRQEKPLLHTPFPGMIDGTREWKVKEGRWPVFIERDFESGIMHVPLGGDQVDRKLRLHEEAHVAWTPLVSDEDVRSWGVAERTIDACEDGRIIDLMARESDEWKKVNWGSSVLTGDQITRHQEYFAKLYAKLSGAPKDPHDLSPEPQLIEAARLLAASRGYAEQTTFNDMANSMPFIQEAVDEMHARYITSNGAPGFDDTVSYAQELERHFAEIEDRILGEVQEMKDADMYPHLPDLDEDSDEDYVWGDMVIERVPLPERLRRNDAKRTRAADKGSVPRYMHRLVSDQRVFGRKRREKQFQGTVLIDHSGSMSLSISEVDEILARWPAVTIASYSGDYNGTLRILAEKGRRAAAGHLSAPGGGGNCVDGPALDWLCKQRGPRIWISDGQVSGQGEDFRPWFRLDAARKVNRGRIKKIEDVRELLGS